MFSVDMKASSVLRNILSYVSSMVLIALLGYFTYGGINGALIGLVFWLASSLLVVLGIIPFFGILIQYVIATDYVYPYLFSITKVQESLLTTGIFVFSTGVTLFVCMISTVLCIVVLWRH